MNCFNGFGCNTTLWILILILILGGFGKSCGEDIFSGCTLPVLLALLYCLYKNGTICSLLGCNNEHPGCGCGCN